MIAADQDDQDPYAEPVGTLSVITRNGRSIWFECPDAAPIGNFLACHPSNVTLDIYLTAAGSPLGKGFIPCIVPHTVLWRGYVDLPAIIAQTRHEGTLLLLSPDQYTQLRHGIPELKPRAKRIVLQGRTITATILRPRPDSRSDSGTRTT